MTTKIEAFLSIEAGLAERLIASWRKISAELFREVRSACDDGDFTQAYRLAETVDLSPLIEDNKTYIRFSTYSSLLFGATRLTDEAKQTVIASGTFSGVVDSAVKLLSMNIMVNAREQIEDETKRYVRARQLEDEAFPLAPGDTRIVRLFDPNQPRAPKGVPEGGQWVKDPQSGSSLDMSKDARYARAREMGFNTDEVLYHGTFKDFEEFQERFARTDSYVGAGFYFSTSQDDVNMNYTNPKSGDWINKIEALAETLHAKDIEEGNEELSAEEYFQKAEEIVTENDGFVIPVFVQQGEQFDMTSGAPLDFKENYNEETDEYGEPTGRAVDFADALRNFGSQFDETISGKMDYAAAEILDYARDYGGIRPADIYRVLRHAEASFEYDGRFYTTGVIIREAAEDAGFNSIRMDAGATFSGFTPAGTHHVIVFKPNQVRSIFAAFDPKNARSGNLLKSEVELKFKANFDPNQPRDEDGKWTSTGIRPSSGEPFPENERVTNEEIIAELKAQNIPLDIVKISNEEKRFTLNGQEYNYAGAAFEDTKTFELYPPFINKPWLRSIVAHEHMHVRFFHALEAREKEMEKLRADSRDAMRPDGTIRDGTSPADKGQDYTADYPALTVLSDMETSWEELKKADGITEYSKAWWKHADAGKAPFMSAVHETLAEMSRLKVERAGVRHSREWERFYRGVNKAYEHATGNKVKVPRKKADGYLAFHLDANWDLVEPAQASLVKVVFNNGTRLFLSPVRERVALYDPDQPRAPKGTPEGGQWVSDRTTPPAGNRQDFKNEMYTREGLADLGYEQMVEKLGESRVHELFDEVRKKELEWEQQMLLALSEGSITLEAARKQGFYLSDFRENDWLELPKDLYHVTTNTTAVLEEGLKTRDELNQSLGKGLGGGASNTISFTRDKKIAEDIQSAMLFAHDVLNDKIVLEDLVRQATVGENATRPFMNDITKSWGGAVTEDGIPIELAAALQGRKAEHIGPFDKRWPPKTPIDTDPEQIAKKLGAEWKVMREAKGGYFFTRPGTVEEMNEVKMATVKKFLAFREYAGGPMDPLFFLSDASAFRNVPRDEIGILHARPKDNTYGYRVSALGEIRTFTGKVISALTALETAEKVIKYDPDFYLRLKANFDPNQPRDDRGRWAETGATFANTKEKGWHRTDGERADTQDIERLQALRVPPAWTSVRLNPDERGALQVIGKDVKGRTQYLYSAEHSEQAAAAKFARLKSFHRHVQRVAEEAEKTMNNTALSDTERDAAAIIKLIDKTAFRIGSTADTRAAKKAYGASTLLGKHVKVDGDKIVFNFTGKKGAAVRKTVRDPNLAKYIAGKKGKPNERLFSADDGSVRTFLKEKAGDDFLVKDYRTWHGTRIALQEVNRHGVPRTATAYNKRRREVAKKVANFLGNTPAVALSAYIDPAVFKKWGPAPEPRRKVDETDYAMMTEFFETHHYDVEPDWHGVPETRLDPDENDADEAALERVALQEDAPLLKLNSRGDRVMWQIASLSTSRMSAYGYTVEAEVLGVEYYRINEQLDNRTCPVCRTMHGRKFKVADAREFLNVLMRVDNPEDFRVLQPWPAQDHASVEALASMSENELVDAGLNVPPYHPLCRGLLVHDGVVPELPDADVSRVNVPASGRFTATKEDFRDLGLLINSEGTFDPVARWNDVVGRSPADVMQAITGLDPEQLAQPGNGVFAEASFSADGKIMLLNYIGPLLEKLGPIIMERRFNFDRKTVEHAQLIADSFDASMGEAIRRSLLSSTRLYKAMGFSAVLLTAGVIAGGYAWAKYGFVPAQSDWDSVRLNALDLFEDYADEVSTNTARAVSAILSSSDPKAIWLLADLTEPVDGAPIGSLLLTNTSWRGELNLNDEEAMDRFDLYFL